ncbi:MAG: Phage/plasmid primase, partial [Candidatus Daviesbacteria bacterium GW2011_GWB1_39_5]
NQDLSKHTKWILTEGELDTLTLESIDIPAVTAGGVTSFKQELASYFKGKKVFVCFDNDKAGKGAAEKVAQVLLEAQAEVLIIDIPEMEAGKDIGDYFHLKHTKDDFLLLVNKARKVELKTKPAGGTQTPDSIGKQKLLDQEISYLEVEEKVLRLLPNSQTGLKLVLAVAVSSSFPNPLMLWLLLVGVPSSGKTDQVRLIKDADCSYYLDNLTQNAFISGERANTDNKVYDLLPLLDKKCLVIKDWTSIFSLDEKMTKKLLGDLVGIYDKEFTKFSSRRGNISYSSAFSQLGCITPATLNKHTNYMNMVGPRFLCHTMPLTAPEAEDESYDLIFSNQDRSLIEREARLYASSYLTKLIKKPLEIKPISKEVQDYLRRAARLMSNCRGIVLLQAASFKNEDGEDIKYFEVLDVQVEEPWRAVQQLITLAKYLAFVSGKGEVGVEELQIIKEVVISSMPADRSQALRTIKEHGG